jgi:hypothetical protein
LTAGAGQPRPPPSKAAGAGLTASVQIPARVETLGDWARRRLLTFFHNWRMT